MAFVDMHIFSRDFLHFDMSLLLLTFTLRGVSNKHCLLSLFSFETAICRCDISALPTPVLNFATFMYKHLLGACFININSSLKFTLILE